MPTESLLALGPIALNWLYGIGGVFVGSLLTLSIILGVFLAVYTGKDNEESN